MRMIVKDDQEIVCSKVENSYVTVQESLRSVYKGREINVRRKPFK
jgi:hypothetical protein